MPNGILTIASDYQTNGNRKQKNLNLEVDIPELLEIHGGEHIDFPNEFGRTIILDARM